MDPAGAYHRVGRALARRGGTVLRPPHTARKLLLSALIAALAVTLVIWLAERRRRADAERLAAAGLALAANGAQGAAWPPEAHRDLERIGQAARNGDTARAAQAAETLVDTLDATAMAFADGDISARAEAFLRRHPDLGKQFLALGERGQELQQQGRATHGLKRDLRAVVIAAADKDRALTERRLRNAEAAAEQALPAMAAAGEQSDRDPATRAHALLLECDIPAALARDLLLPCAEPVDKLLVLARTELNHGSPQRAAWLLELAADMLGLRAVGTPAGAGSDLSLNIGTVPPAPEQDLDALRAVGNRFLQAQAGIGRHATAAELLWREGEAIANAGSRDRGVMMMRAALNAFGMTDQAIRDALAAQRGDTR